VAGKNLTVYLTSDVSKFRRGLRTAEGDARTFGGRMRKIGTGIGVGLAGAAAVGVAAAVNAAQEGIKSAVEDEAGQKRLARQAKNSAGATDDQVKALEDYVDIAQKKTGLDDDTIRTTLARFIRSTGDLTEAQKLNDAAMATSLGTGKEFAPVAEAIAKAYDGNAGALKRIGINVPKGDKIALINALNSQFKGAITDDAKSYAGGTRRVATAWDELTEAFGSGVLDNLGDGNEQMSTFADTLYDSQDDAKELGKWVGDIATSMASLATTIGPVVQKFNELNDMSNGVLTDGTLVTVWEKTALAAKLLAGGLTGNDQAIAEALNGVQGINAQSTQPGRGSWGDGNGSVPARPQLDTFSVSSLYTVDPARSRSNRQVHDGRSNARGAQREARTGNRP
jgi:hypothetical protein